MANLGDSRAVACIHGAARQLTQVRHPGFALKAGMKILRPNKGRGILFIWMTKDKMTWKWKIME